MAKTPITIYRFIREEDVSGVSGRGHVANVVEFPDGTCVMKWKTSPSSTAIYEGKDDLMEIHGHEGRAFLEKI